MRLLLAFIIGACLPHLVTPPLPLAPFTSGLLVLVAAPLAWSRTLRPALALLLGIGWAGAALDQAQTQRLDPRLDGTIQLVNGTVVGLPERGVTRTRFIFELEGAAQGATPLPARVALSWYRNAPPLEPGMHGLLRVKLREPRGLHNPGGYDYGRWLLRRGIGARGHVIDDPRNRLQPAASGGSLDRWRDRRSEAIRTRFGEGVGGALLRALTFGDRRGLDPDDLDAFNRTGTRHLIAISGLHIGLVAGLAGLLAGALWRRLPPLANRVPTPVSGAVAAALAALLYALMAGLALPTQRALVMCLYVCGLVILRRAVAPGHGLAIAAVAVLAIDPLAPLDPGFWLSFGAVGVILLALAGRAGTLPAWRSGVRIQWVLSLLLAPLLLVLFGQVALVAPLANLVMVPWFTLVLVPAALAALVLEGLAGFALPLEVVADLLARTADLLRVWGALEASVWVPAGEGVGAVAVVLAVGALLWFAPVGLAGRALAAVLLVAALGRGVPRQEPGGFRATLLDVGQGLAVVVETARHLLVYDTGPRYPGGFDSGRAVVLPYLHHLGAERVDRLVLSNADNDHAGGARALVKGIDIDSVRSGEPVGLEVAAGYCLDGDGWVWDGVRFEVLHPDDPDAWSGNDRSCVMRITGIGGSLLLAGDLEQRGEAALVARHRTRLAVDAVVVPHHGSRTSSTPVFVAATGARLALVSAGRGNRFGLPAPQIVARWQAAGAEVVSTAERGAIVLVADKAGLRIAGPLSADAGDGR